MSWDRNETDDGKHFTNDPVGRLLGEEDLRDPSTVNTSSTLAKQINDLIAEVTQPIQQPSLGLIEPSRAPTGPASPPVVKQQDEEQQQQQLPTSGFIESKVELAGSLKLEDRDEKYAEIMLGACGYNLMGSKCPDKECWPRHHHLCPLFHRNQCGHAGFFHDGLFHIKKSCKSVYTATECKVGPAVCDFGHDEEDLRTQVHQRWSQERAVKAELEMRKQAAEANPESKAKKDERERRGLARNRDRRSQTHRLTDRQRQLASRI